MPRTTERRRRDGGGGVGFRRNAYTRRTILNQSRIWVPGRSRRKGELRGREKGLIVMAGPVLLVLKKVRVSVGGDHGSFHKLVRR